MTADVLVKLPDALRSELKDPIGPVFTDTDALFDAASEPLATIGDVVTYHVIEAGRTPDVAMVDDRTERSAVDDEIADSIAAYDGFDREISISNPAATLTSELLSALADAYGRDESTLVVVDGEEDLAVLPAIVYAPVGSSIIYGQPGEGMVHIVVEESLQEDIAALLERMDGDIERLRDLLDR